MKKFLALVLCAALLVGACACKSDKGGRTLFTFDGEIVKEEEFVFSYRNIITYFESQFETSFAQMYDIKLSNGETLADLCETYAVQEVGYAAVVRKIISDNNIPWTADNQTHFETLMEYYIALDGGEDALAEKLAANGMTVEMLENSVRQYVYLGAAADWLYENGRLETPDSEQLLGIFNERYAKIKTVYFSFEGLSEKETDVQYIKIAQVRQQLQQGEDIDKIISDVGGDSGTYLITDSADFDADLVTAVFAQDTDTVGEVKTANGYHIFLRMPLDSEDFEENEEALLNTVKDERFTGYIDTLYNSAKMTVDEKIYNEIIKNTLSEYK